MSKFINATFMDGVTTKGLILNIDAIASYRENDADPTKTLVSTIDRSIPSSPVLNVLMSESAFTAAIAGATDSPHSFITINAGDPTNGFFNYKISVSQLSGVSECTAAGFTSYNQIYMPNISILLLTTSSLPTIFTQLYA
jgi:hypothetical protein